jgi:hypothetical protein
LTNYVVVLEDKELQALADHPAILQPDDPGLFWVQKVKRGVSKLRVAMPEDQAGAEMAAAMREQYPMLDHAKSFVLAAVALAALSPTEGTSDG